MRVANSSSLTKRPGFFARLKENLGELIKGDDFGFEGDRRLRDYAVGGAAVGAVAGAFVGAKHGFDSHSQNAIEEYNSTESVVHNRLDGYRYSRIPDYRTECETIGYGENATEHCTTELEGWWHNYSPRIDRTTVDTYEVPRYRHTEFWEPLKGGLLGAVGGGLLGVGAGAMLAVARNVIVEDDFGSPPSKPELPPLRSAAVRDFAGTAAIGGGVLGAGIGGYLGYQAGTVESGQEQVFTRHYSEPVLQREYLGDIPDDWYEWNWSGIGWPSGDRGFSHGRERVYRNNPVYQPDGSVTYRPASKTYETARYGPIGGAIVGGATGAVVGLAAGTALGIANKFLEESKLTG